MSVRWINRCKRILNRIEKMKEIEEKDRLEHVRDIRFMLGALQRSLAGWVRWVNNPQVMTRFTEGELVEMSRELSELTRSFIEYDLEVTKKGVEKGLAARRRLERKKKEGTSVFYI